jgi:hypothetical protein
MLSVVTAGIDTAQQLHGMTRDLVEHGEPVTNTGFAAGQIQDECAAADSGDAA